MGNGPMSYQLTDAAFAGMPEPVADTDYMLDETTINEMFRAAAAGTSDPDEQTWLVVHAIAAGWTPTVLADRTAAFDGVGPIGIFADTDPDGDDV
jgi:hypothetical protein